MALMVGSLYDALRSANVPEDKARKAAEDVADFDKQAHDIHSDFQGLRVDFQGLRGRVDLLTWMVGFNLALTLAVLWRAFVI